MKVKPYLIGEDGRTLMSPTLMALVAASTLLALLVMALVIVSVARKMDRTDGGFTPKPSRLQNARQLLAAFQTGDAAQAKAAGKQAAKSASAGATIAVIAALVTAGGGIVAGLSKGKPPVEREITAGPLHGAMLARRHPDTMALIVPGSGPTDRDGNSRLGVGANTYKLLAEGLAEHGVGSVRIDKRGMYSSAGAGDGNAVSVDIYAEDIRAWIDAIKAETDVDCVWLVGHSEGALMVSAAAQGRSDVCGLVLLAGAGRPVGQVLREQLRANPANAPLLQQAMHAIDELEAGRHVDTAGMQPALLQLFAPPVQDFWISEIKVDPVDLVRRADVPTLIVQGTTDIQVSIADARLLDAAPNTRLELVEGMNHVLKQAPADRAGNLATYTDASLPLSPGLAERIAEFMENGE
jgi:pimeloyl-ACP methyl ester carboxylesterase